MTGRGGRSAARLSLAALALALALPGCWATQGGRLTRDTLRSPADDGLRTYVAALQRRARELHLARSEQWLRLVHYHRAWDGYLESQADGTNFFLSPHGKEHPELELDATIAGFFSELAPYDVTRPDSRNVQHPICQFPARFMWLSRELSIDPAKLPPHDCSRYEQFRDNLRATSVSLVFSSYYLNNPASAFGHTFLRFHRKDDGVPESQRALLDVAVEFSADPDTNFAPLYAIKGMTGAFPGTFRRLPYYYKVREYNDYESRDLWEYRLNLTPAQLDMLIAHIWELGSTFFDYFYLTENCSYHILGALEAADLDVDLTGKLHWPVLPADAIRALYAYPGLVTGVDYRPSSRSRFTWETRDMSHRETHAIEALARHGHAALDGLDPGQRIAVLDAAQDLVDLRYAKELVDDTGTGPGAHLKQQLLEERASILVPSPDRPQPVPWSRMPQIAHASRRISLGGGADTQAGRWVAGGLRLALHDLADPSDGFPELAELEFLPTRLRYDVPTRRVRLDQLDLVHVVSLTPQNPFDRHISWEMRLGSQRLDDAGCHCYVGHVMFGGGLAFATRSERAAVFFLANTHVWSGPHLDGLFHAPIRLGIGPEGGLRLRVTHRLIALVIGEWDWLPGQTGFATWNVTGTVRWAVTHALALDLEAERDQTTASGVVSTMLYF